ncbi:MAG: hypothetical protein N4J56_003748 [Chroococcidiopsis sp. SAG 2025]|nr:hypothetical protein [Chroococcidiopsis sp. SAG 2025]
MQQNNRHCNIDKANAFDEDLLSTNTKLLSNSNKTEKSNKLRTKSVVSYQGAHERTSNVETLYVTSLQSYQSTLNQQPTTINHQPSTINQLSYFRLKEGCRMNEKIGRRVFFYHCFTDGAAI